MKYDGYGIYRWTADEEQMWQEFIDDPEAALDDVGWVKPGSKERYELWCEWFLALKDTPKHERMTWKEYLIDVYQERYEMYVTRDTDTTPANYDAGNWGGK